MAQPSRETSGTSTTAAADLDDLVSRVREVVDQHLQVEKTAQLVAEQLRRALPSPRLLPAGAWHGNPDHYEQHTLHVDSDRSFSIVALVWRRGQQTLIHDHVSWYVVGVLDGTEQEAVYQVRGHGSDRQLVATDRHKNRSGTVSELTPPEDIHSVRNDSGAKTISIHIYGTDMSALGKSIRRTYVFPMVDT